MERHQISGLAAASLAGLLVLLGAAPALAGASWTLISDQSGNQVVAVQDGGATQYYTPGDVLFNGLVNMQDIELIGQNWLNTQADTSNGSSLVGDANGDGIVNFQDIETVASHWGQASPGVTFGSASSVPEPSTGLIFGIFAVGMWLVRRCAKTA